MALPPSAFYSLPLIFWTLPQIMTGMINEISAVPILPRKIDCGSSFETRTCRFTCSVFLLLPYLLSMQRREHGQNGK